MSVNIKSQRASVKKGISTGIDIISIERLRRAGQSMGFLSRVFTQAELGRPLNGKTMFRRLSGCFAAKEAFAKALGTGMANGLKWKDIEVAAGKEGVNPRLVLYGCAIRLLGQRKAHLSIAYSQDHAFAFVVIEQARVESLTEPLIYSQSRHCATTKPRAKRGGKQSQPLDKSMSYEIAEPVPSVARNLRVCFGFASQPQKRSSQRQKRNKSEVP